ncbi:MAG: preprotein translocase subunit SecE [Planctomycetes bacterium]|nr:preprotein translocase subunit SecE [Planctomycetota bacterium]
MSAGQDKTMALFENYRRGAGRRTRAAASLLLLAALAWAGYAMLEYGNTRLDRLLGNENPFWGRALVTAGGNLTEWITPSFIVALLFFAAGALWLRAVLNRPRAADLLIETEAELKRVKWAPRKEAARATSVVLYFVFWFAMIMLVYDLTFSMGIGMLQGQRWDKAGWGRVVSMVLRLDPPTDDKDAKGGP